MAALAADVRALVPSAKIPNLRFLYDAIDEQNRRPAQIVKNRMVFSLLASYGVQSPAFDY